VTDLNTLIPSDSGWELVLAWDINDRGEIVGFGQHDGKFLGFFTSLLTPSDETVHDKHFSHRPARQEQSSSKDSASRVSLADQESRAQSIRGLENKVGGDAGEEAVRGGPLDADWRVSGFVVLFLGVGMKRDVRELAEPLPLALSFTEDVPGGKARNCGNADVNESARQATGLETESSQM
jgi:hypothetical protein